jgi:hypothetical protein
LSTGATRSRTLVAAAVGPAKIEPVTKICAVEDCRPADLTEDLAADEPRLAPRTLALRGRERVDGDVAGHPAHDANGETDEHERDSDVP